MTSFYQSLDTAAPLPFMLSFVLNNPDPPRHFSIPEGYTNNIINDFNIPSFLTHPIVLPLILMTKYHMDVSYISYHHMVTSHTYLSLITIYISYFTQTLSQ
jgi:hypothetical protein